MIPGVRRQCAAMSGKKANRELMVEVGVGSLIAFNSSGGAAEWIMVLPAGAGGTIATVDTRGPFRVADFKKLASESLHAAGGRIPIDENHATDLAAPNGAPSPARGWATEFEVRSDGIYARVEWSATGAQLMGERAYRYISPALSCDRQNNVLRILRASLTNTPNLRGMAALHSTETDNMDLLAKLRTMLGLADDADEAAVIAKLESWMKDTKTATASALAPIAKAAGLKDDADSSTILNDVTALASAKPADQTATVTALQTELKEVTTTLNTFTRSVATDKATAFVDGAIKMGRVGVKPMRDHYIAMHAIDSTRVEKEINAMPVLGSSGALETPPENKDGKIVLNAEQKNAASILGISHEDYRKTLQSEAAD